MHPLRSELIKTFAYVVLPGFAASYFILSFPFDFPAVEYVLGISVIMIYLLNLYLRLKASVYTGQMVITKKFDGKTLFSLEIDKSPEDIANMSEVLFKVTKTPSEYEDMD